MKAYIETRSQKAAGQWPKQGPDRYVAVQIVPEGVTPLTSLRSDSARKRGIQIVQCGEYYSRSLGPRSLYNAAITKAKAIAEQTNKEVK